MADFGAVFAEALGGIFGGFIWATILYGIYYNGKRIFFRASGKEKPEFITKGTKAVFIAFVVLGLLTSVMIQYDDTSTASEDVWFTESSYLGEAPDIYMQDLTYSPPNSWESVAADINRGFSETRVVAPQEGDAAVLVGRMPYNTTHEEFFTNKSVEVFERNLRVSDRATNLSFGEVQVYDDNLTKWLVYNASGTYNGHKAEFSYQVSVSQGTYYVLMYYATPEDFNKYYKPAISTMRNSSLYVPLSFDYEEIQVEPLNITQVSPYAGYETDVGLKEGYRYVRNESMKGSYKIEIESTSPIEFLVFPQEEYSDFMDGYDYDRLIYQSGSNISIEREFLEGNYTIYTLNNEKGYAQVRYNITRLDSRE
jgi:hypothetical protein